MRVYQKEVNNFQEVIALISSISRSATSAMLHKTMHENTQNLSRAEIEKMLRMKKSNVLVCQSATLYLTQNALLFGWYQLGNGFLVIIGFPKDGTVTKNCQQSEMQELTIRFRARNNYVNILWPLARWLDEQYPSDILDKADRVEIMYDLSLNSQRINVAMFEELIWVDDNDASQKNFFPSVPRMSIPGPIVCMERGIGTMEEFLLVSPTSPFDLNFTLDGEQGCMMDYTTRFDFNSTLFSKDLDFHIDEEWSESDLTEATQAILCKEWGLSSRDALMKVFTEKWKKLDWRISVFNSLSLRERTHLAISALEKHLHKLKDGDHFPFFVLISGENDGWIKFFATQEEVREEVYRLRTAQPISKKKDVLEWGYSWNG